MKKKLFSEAADEILIEMVYKNEILYDQDHSDFRNVEKKNGIWKLIADNVGKDVELCKRRWKDLRDNYFKIIRKNKSSESTSTFSQKWPLFEKLKFLNNMRRERIQFGCTTSESLRDFQCPNLSEGESSNNSHQNAVNEVPVTSQNKTIPPSKPLVRAKALKRKYLEEKTKRIKERSELVDYLMKNNKEEDDVELFMRSVAATVKKLPPHKIRLAKKEVLATVSRIEEESLYEQTETSSFVESSYNPSTSTIYTKIEIEDPPSNI